MRLTDVYVHVYMAMYTVSQKTTLLWQLACYNSDRYQPILIIFGRNVAKKVSSQTILNFEVEK